MDRDTKLRVYLERRVKALLNEGKSDSDIVQQLHAVAPGVKAQQILDLIEKFKAA